MNKQTVKNSTLDHNLCINCGICKICCPVDAIVMKPNKFNEPNPQINIRRCINCGVCVDNCPNTKEKMLSEAEKISAFADPSTFGLENANYFLAWNPCNEERLKSSSGGAITKLIEFLLKNSIIDAVIHTERLERKIGELHYGACISTTVEEVKNRTSSSYQSIDFSIIKNKIDINKTYLITGTPCVIKGFKNYCNSKNIKYITCALICSHNVNGQFSDFFAQMHNIEINTKYFINFRNKDNIPNADNFNNHIYTNKKDLLKMNRFESNWTNIWRLYFFALNPCCFCSDFWGYQADISVKDAWGKWSHDDPLGKSIVIIRNIKIKDYFLACGLMEEELSYDIMKDHQRQTSDFKQKAALSKNFDCLFSKNNRTNGLLKYLFISRMSKYLYKLFGYHLTNQFMHAIIKH